MRVEFDAAIVDRMRGELRMQVQASRAELKREPVRLGRDPIVEAICEMRFAGSADVVALLPGLLQPKIGSEFPTLERLPVADIPAQIRQFDPNLQHAPLIRLRGDRGVISIGDRVLSVAVAGGRYPGWTSFKATVESVFQAAFDTGFIGRVERVSVKYVNAFPAGDPQELSKLTKVSLNLGGLCIGREPVQLRVETKQNGHTTAVQIMNSAKVQQPGMAPFDALVLDIDTIQLEPGSDVEGRFRLILDAAHAEEKRVFFSLLSEATLAECDPIYD